MFSKSKNKSLLPEPSPPHFGEGSSPAWARYPLPSPSAPCSSPSLWHCLSTPRRLSECCRSSELSWSLPSRRPHRVRGPGPTWSR